MDPAELDAATDREGRALLAAAKTGLDAPVPACPGWVVADVLGHMGRVHRSVAGILERGTRDAPTDEIPDPPAGDAVLAFFEEGFERLLGALATTPPDTPVYTWADPPVAAFYHRRMAHELAIHRFDVESAHGTPAPFDAEQATDAISEFYEVVLPFAVRRAKRSLPSGSLHLHRTDGPGEWFVRSVDGELVATREHAKGDVAVRGSASDLLVFVWNRGRPPALELFGDAEVAAAWSAVAP
jgi:uncharacterized protein (TIGR03083 family)